MRNITDQFAGVAGRSSIPSSGAADPAVVHLPPEFNLPRKFKIAVNGAVNDRAATYVRIGFAVKREANWFQVIVGGGLGRTPVVGHVIREFLPWPHLLTYLDAILRVYNRHGRRDNIHKARIKILVKERGIDKFREEVDAEWEHFRDGPATVTSAEIRRIEGRFTRPAYEKLGDVDYTGSKTPFNAWLRRNVHPHKVRGYAAVSISLKKTGVPPGDITSDQMGASPTGRPLFLRRTARHARAEPRLRGRASRTARPWLELRALGRHANIGLLTNIISCPGGISARSPTPSRSRWPRRSSAASTTWTTCTTSANWIEYLRLHERLRPPPRRPHRHPRRR